MGGALEVYHWLLTSAHLAAAPVNQRKQAAEYFLAGVLEKRFRLLYEILAGSSGAAPQLERILAEGSILTGHPHCFPSVELKNLYRCSGTFCTVVYSIMRCTYT